MWHGFGHHGQGHGSALLLGVLAGAVAANAAIVAYAYTPGGPLRPALDHVTSVTWVLDLVALTPGPGFTAHPTSAFRLILTDTNTGLGTSTLNYTTVSVVPSSFSVVRSSLPPIAPGLTENLTVTVETPAAGYSGPLTVYLS